MSDSPTDLPAADIGAMITSGAADWQIFQRDEHGWAQLALTGRWVCPVLATRFIRRYQR